MHLPDARCRPTPHSGDPGISFLLHPLVVRDPCQEDKLMQIDSNATPSYLPQFTYQIST